MLRINVPSNGPARINFSTFGNYQLPLPPSGIDSEVNNDLILLFEDEEQAEAYAGQLEQISGSQKKVGKEIIAAINNDDFVKMHVH